MYRLSPSGPLPLTSDRCPRATSSSSSRVSGRITSPAYRIAVASSRSVCPSAPRLASSRMRVAPSSRSGAAIPRRLLWNRMICAAFPTGSAPQPCTRSSASPGCAPSNTADTTGASRRSSPAPATTCASVSSLSGASGAHARAQSTGPHPSPEPRLRDFASHSTATLSAETDNANSPSTLIASLTSGSDNAHSRLGEQSDNASRAIRTAPRTGRPLVAGSGRVGAAAIPTTIIEH